MSLAGKDGSFKTASVSSPAPILPLETSACLCTLESGSVFPGL